MSTRLSYEHSEEDGFTGTYLRIRDGKVHRTVEMALEGNTQIHADLDRNGQLLGVEIIENFSAPKPPGVLRAQFGAPLERDDVAGEDGQATDDCPGP